MCGICGKIIFDNTSVEKREILSMMSAMKHRGPDDDGTFVKGNVGLGHVRLSIIDLSEAGHQPMISEDGRYVIVYNGEIYNYIELRKQLSSKYQFRTNTDTEVLLNAYREWGADCLSRFNGMFAFAIYDTVTKELFFARDRFGIKPFYYYQDQNRFIFASEERAILPFLEEKRANEKAIFEYLNYNRTDQNNDTFFESLRKLPHGAYATIQDGRVQIRKWYELQRQLQKPFSEPSEFYGALNQSITFRLRSDVPVGVCLSGGLDSSGIVATLLREHNKNDLNTFSAVYEKGEKADESDFIDEFKPQLQNMFFTRPTADTLFADLEHFVDCHSEPVASLGPYAQFKVMELAREHVKVTLDGQGADEELAGYHYFFGSYFKELLRRLAIFRLASETRYYLRNHESLLALKYLGLYLVPWFFKDYISRISHDFMTQEFYSKEKSNSDIKKGLYNPRSLNESLLQHFEFKLEHLLKWEDHNSMWHSIESRVPFLDHNLVERTLSLPSEDKIRNGSTKYFLREAMKGVLPEKIRLRQDKIGFATPSEKWFRTQNFKDFTTEILSSPRFKQRGYLNSERCLQAYQLHLKGEINIAKEIWKWINLELWFRTFIDTGVEPRAVSFHSLSDSTPKDAATVS